MRASAGAGRPSCLAMNPNNLQASAARREELLAAFLKLDEDAQADLLEAVETMAHRASAEYVAERVEARSIFRRIYAEAGWPPAGS